MNIKRIADEIFRAPSDEDLIKRALERIHFINFSTTEMHTLFPNGAYHVTYFHENSFPKFNNYFIDKVEKWNEFVMNPEDPADYIWEKAKLNGKTIVRLSRLNRAPLSYWFEKGVL
jgi:hypothetical protein